MLMRGLFLLLALLFAGSAAQAQKIYRFDAGGNLVQIAERDPARRYRLVTGPENVPAYFELRPSDEAEVDALAAIPPLPYSGNGRVVAERLASSPLQVPSGLPPGTQATPIDYTTIRRDRGGYHRPANPDRFTVGPAQGGVFLSTLQVTFIESTPGVGCTANSGERRVDVRIGTAGQGGGQQSIARARLQAAASGDTDVFLPIPELELAAGEFLRVLVSQNCGGPLPISSRFTLRRVGAIDE